jgi:hypothetical protein
MGNILSTEAPASKTTSIELDPEAAGWLLIQFHPQKGFCLYSGGEIPADQMHLQLSILQQKILAAAAMREMQAAAKEQMTRVQPARAVSRSPFGG